MNWVICDLYSILTENSLENKGELLLEMKNNVWRRLRRAKKKIHKKQDCKRLILGEKKVRRIYGVMHGYMRFFVKKGDIWGLGYIMRFSKPIYHPERAATL